jgi:isopenicillin N synthase-like dioxygenase
MSSAVPGLLRRFAPRNDDHGFGKDAMDQLPIIDLASFAENDDAALERVAAEIGRACREIGFFYVVNHGVAAETMAAAFAQSALFFALPIQVKRAIAIEKIGGNRGYSGLMHEALDPSMAADLKEAFNIGLEIAADDPDLLAGKPFRSLNAWPDLLDFRTTLLDYFAECAKLGGRLHRAFATDLRLNPDFFENKFDRPMATLRLLHYPPTPPDVVEGQLGAGEHTDYGNLTLLATDSVGGLEVRTRAGAWTAAPVMPGAFIVNIGDCLMRWTNDTYVSTPHRVVNRSGRERYSIAFFFDPNPDALVAAIPNCVPAGEEPLYPPIAAADHLRARLAASTAHVKV